MTDQLSDLVELTDLLHLRALDVYRQRTASVTRTQGSLDEISVLRTAAQADTQSVDARRMVGSDAMWQGWLAIRTTALQQEMAINRALQIEGLSHAQSTFAKLDAARGLQKAQRAALDKRRAGREAETLDWLSMLRSWKSS